MDISKPSTAQRRSEENVLLEVIAMKCVKTVSFLLSICLAAGLLMGCTKGHSAVQWDSYDASTRTLYLIDQGLNDEDIAPLQNLTGLVSLTLTGNKITDLTPLAGLTNLTGLYLSDNQITDLTPLAGLTNLTELYLSDNQISDLTPLAGLAKLTQLYIGDNRITDLTPLAGLTNLTDLSVLNNDIADWSYVAHVPNVEGNPSNAVVLTDTTAQIRTGQIFSLSLDETQSIPLRWRSVISDEGLVRVICTAVDSSGLNPGAPPGSPGGSRVFYFEALSPGVCSIDFYKVPINSEYDLVQMSPDYSYTFTVVG